jgi:RNA polymerase sigma factor (TIGR02999 family)
MALVGDILLDMSDVTQILSRLQHGDPAAAEQLLPLVYDELRKLASARIAHEKPGQTLQATALVHEAYLRLVKHQTNDDWHSRGHFFGAAAEAMRRILVESARRKGRMKHGGEHHRIEIPNDVAMECTVSADDLLSLHEALERLEAEDASAARLVKLRFFAGLNLKEIAEITDTPLRTTEREWQYARSWLHRAMSN